MSYKSPKWYGMADPTAGAKAFEKSFKESFTMVDSYYTGLKKEVKEANKELASKTKQITDEIANFKNLGSNSRDGIRSLATQVMSKYKSGVSMEGSNVFSRAFSANVKKPSPEEMQRDIDGFKDFSSDLNYVLDKALTFNDSNVDKSNQYTKYTKSILRHIKENPDSIKYEYKDNEFNFKVKFNHPIHGEQELDRATISSMVRQVESTKEAKDVKKKVYNETTKSLANKVDSIVKAEGGKRIGEGKAGYTSGIDITSGVVKDYLSKTSAEDIDSDYENFVNFDDDNYKLEVFENTQGGDLILESINSMPGYLKEKAIVSLRNILDTPMSDDITFREEFAKVPLKDVSIDEFKDIIKEYKTNALEDKMIEDVLGQSVNTSSRAPARTTTRTYSRTSDKSTSKGGSASKDISGYIKTKGEMFRGLLSKVFINPDDPFAFAPKAQGSNMVGADADMIQGDNTIELSGPITKQNSQSRIINSITFDPNTETMFAYYDTDKVKGPEVSDKEFNVYEPKQLMAFWQSITPEFKSGKDAAAVLEGFKKEAEAIFDGANISKLEDDKMSKWFTWYENNGTNAKQKLIAHAANNPNLYSLTDKGVSHWFNFYQRNKTAIDLAEMKK